MHALEKTHPKRVSLERKAVFRGKGLAAFDFLGRFLDQTVDME
jgi:hypothetical protein